VGPRGLFDWLDWALPMALTSGGVRTPFEGKSFSRHRLAGGGAASGATQHFDEHDPWSGCCLWEGCVTVFAFEFSSLSCLPILFTLTLLQSQTTTQSSSVTSELLARQADALHTLFAVVPSCEDNVVGPKSCGTVPSGTHVFVGH